MTGRYVQVDSHWLVEKQDSAETRPHRRLRRLDASDDLTSLIELVEPLALFQEPLAIVSQSHRDGEEGRVVNNTHGVINTYMVFTPTNLVDGSTKNRR